MATRGLLVLLLVLLPLLLLLCSARDPAADTVTRLREQAHQETHNPIAHLQLALALHELNHQKPDGGSRVPEAEQEYRKALELIDPAGEHAHVYVYVQGNLGALLLSADRPAEAIAELQDALQLGQQLQKQLKQQIKRLRKKSRADKKQQKQQGEDDQQQAVLKLQEALQEVQKQLGGLLFNLGKALTSVGRLPEADEVYSQAAATAYTRDFASYGKALAAMRTMPQDLAAQAAQVCQAASQHFASHDKLAFLKGIQEPGTTTAAATGPDSDAGRVDTTKPAGWIDMADSVDLVWLYFALFKHHHHGIRDFKTAWHYLQVGNQIMAAHVEYDHIKDQRNFRTITGLFRAPFVTSGNTDRTPIFIVGMPRSGSTLVEQMLASHSQVFAAGEDTALAPLTPAINKALTTTPADQQPDMLQHFAQKYISSMRGRVPANWSTTTHAAPLNDSSPSASRIVDKMLRNLWLIGYIHMLLPQACIVHVVRHPLDVALSCYTQPFGYSASSLAWSWDLSAIATQLRMTWELAEHWDQQLPGRVHTVFYEELVERPESVAVQLLSACGLPWEPGVLKFHDINRPVQTASMEQVRQPLYKTSVQRWKVYRHQLEPLRDALAPLIARYEQMLQQRLAAAPPPATTEAGSKDHTGSSDGVEGLTKDEL